MEKRKEPDVIILFLIAATITRAMQDPCVGRNKEGFVLFSQNCDCVKEKYYA